MKPSKSINVFYYNSIITLLWFLGALIHAPIIIITPTALFAAAGVLFVDYFKSLDETEQKKLLRNFISIFGLVVAISTAGSIIDPLITAMLYFGASTTVANIVTIVVFFLILPAWFALYTIGEGQMIDFVFKRFFPKGSNKKAKQAGSKKKEPNTMFVNFLGFANAFIANGTGLVLGSVAVLNILPSAYSTMFILQIIAVFLGYVGGVLAAASLTRESLIKVYKKLCDDNKKLKSFETTVCIITGLALASFNFKAGSKFITTIVDILHITINPSLFNVLGLALGGVCFILTIVAASALLLNLNEAFVEEEEMSPVKNFKKYNLSGYIGKIIIPLSFIGSIVGGIMIYDALMHSLPTTGLISLSSLVYLSAIVSICFLIKDLYSGNSPKSTFAFSILTTTAAVFLLCSSNIAPVLFGSSFVLSIIAAYTFFKMYKTGFEACANRLLNTHYVKDFIENTKQKIEQKELLKAVTNSFPSIITPAENNMPETKEEQEKDQKVENNLLDKH